MENKKTGKGNIIIGVVLVVIVLALGALTFFFYRQIQSIKKNPNQVAQAELDAVLNNLSKLIDLPKDETPTLATVLDKDKLKDQPFFADSQNGDKIVIYSKNKKAIIYRMKDNKLINVGPIIIDPKTLPQMAIVDAGGDVKGVTQKIAEKFPDTISISSASTVKNKSAVKQLTVVDVTGKAGDLANQIATEIGGTVSNTLPAGETIPENTSIIVYVK